MKCRCGHGRVSHRRGRGTRQPCWARVNGNHQSMWNHRNQDLTKGHGLCKCRDWHPEAEKIDPMPDNYTPGTWRHTDWCPTPTGHRGDCWVENNRALGIEPGPAMVIVDATTGERTDIW